MAMKANFGASFLDIKKGFQLDKKIFERAAKFAMIDALKKARGGVSSKLKGVFPPKVLKYRLLDRLNNKGASIFVGLNPVDLAYLNPQKTAKGIKANGVYYAGAFFKKNSERKSVWMRQFQSRKRADWDEYLKLIKVVQELPIEKIEEILEESLDGMEQHFLNRYKHHLERLDVLEKTGAI